MNNNFTSIILIVIAIGVFFVNIDPQYKKVQSLRAEHAKFQEAIDSSAKLKAVREGLNLKLAAFPAENLDKLGTFLPEKIDPARLAADISGIASKRGIRIDGFKINGAGANSGETVIGAGVGKPYKTTTVTFSFKASYENLVEFVKILEKSLRLIDITSITVKADSLSSTLTYTLTLQVYSLK